MDNWIIEDQERAEKIRNMWKEANEYFEWDPTRLMGDWPESSLLPGVYMEKTQAVDNGTFRLHLSKNLDNALFEFAYA